MPHTVVHIRKASGELVPYNPQKIKESLKRAQVDIPTINVILEKLDPFVQEEMTTKEVYDKVHALLKDVDRPKASTYNLKQAIMELGPTGYPFEKFMSGVLLHLGYLTELNQVLAGRCITHETDIIATKAGVRYMIEAKYHNSAGSKTDAQVVLYTQARFEDICAAWDQQRKAEHELHRVWLITNTKLTTDARHYAECVGMHVSSWDYPEGFSIRELITQSGTYPITSLLSLEEDQRQVLLGMDKVLCTDVLALSKETVEENNLETVVHEAQALCALSGLKQSSNEG